jgi:hypothetical protein
VSLSEIKVNEEFIEEMDKYRVVEKGTGLVEACSLSPMVFSERMLGIRLYAWQVYVMNLLVKALDGDYWTKEFDILTSRQIGKSTLLEIFNLWVCIFNKKAGGIHNNSNIGVISASDEQSKKLLRDMKLLLSAGDAFMARTYVDSDGKPLFGKKYLTLLIDEKQENNTTTMTFKSYSDKHGQFLLKGSYSGSNIKSFPPTSVVLGNTFGVLEIDEAGKSDRIPDMFYYDYIYPTGNAMDALRVNLSTPWEPSGFFYRNADPGDEYPEHNTQRFLFTIDAIRIENPKYYETVMKTVDALNRDGKTDEVQRAYYCRFVKGELNYFIPDKVRGIFSKDYQMLEGCRSSCDMGIDFGGQVTSRTVITISRLNEEGMIERIYCKAYEVGKDLSLIPDIEELLTRFNVERIIPDECPAGDFLIRLMIEKGWNVTPMNFRTDKVKKYGAFRAKLNKGFVTSYEDSDLRIEMLALEQNEGNRQSYIMHAPGYTDDLIDSFVMSTYYYIEDDEDVMKWYDLPETSEFETGESFYEQKF